MCVCVSGSVPKYKFRRMRLNTHFNFFERFTFV